MDFNDYFKLPNGYLSIANLLSIIDWYYHLSYNSEMFGKVIVASKVPLPNYRPDLDDKRPQREVITWFVQVG